MPAEIMLTNLASPAIKERINDETIAIIPVGSIEQHGPHLPVDVDSFLVTEIAKRAAQSAADCNVLVTPTVTFGCSQHHLYFPGTLSLSQDTFIRVIQDICNSLLCYGVKRIVVLNGHAGNNGALRVALNEVKLHNKQAMIFFANHWVFSKKAMAQLRESERGGLGHACELETSLYLALAPEKVHMEKVLKEIPPPKVQRAQVDLMQSGDVAYFTSMEQKTISGIVGDPTVASKEKGEKLLYAAVEEFAALLQDVKNAVSDPIRD
ncbi:MAG: creatininase family protein [bacterium]|jgi:creatinine amidohydrolase